MDPMSFMNPYVIFSLLMGILVFYSQWFDTPVSLLKPLPGPMSWPLVGHLPQVLASMCDVDGLHARLAASYDALFSYVVFGRRVVVVQDAALAKEALECEELCRKVKDGFRAKMSERTNVGIVTSSGLSWKENRAVVVDYLREGSTKANLEEWCISEATKLVDCFSRHNGRPFTFHHHIVRSTVGILCRVMFGETHVLEDAAIERFADLIMRRQKEQTPGIGRHLLPSFISRLPYGACGRRHELETQLVDIVATYLADREHTGSSTCLASAYQRAMEEQQHKADGDTACFLDEDNLLWTCYDMLVEGAHKVSLLTSQAIILLSSHPEVQSRLREDMEREVGRGKSPPLARERNLPLFDAVLLETSRLGQSARGCPAASARVAEADVQIGEFEIPQGSIVVLKGDQPKDCSRAWNKPLTFNPDRFLSDGSVANRARVKPFGTGRRMCPAGGVSSSIFFILLSRICQRFTLCAQDDASAELTDHSSIVAASLRAIQRP